MRIARSSITRHAARVALVAVAATLLPAAPAAALTVTALNQSVGVGESFLDPTVHAWFHVQSDGGFTLASSTLGYFDGTSTVDLGYYTGGPGTPHDYRRTLSTGYGGAGVALANLGPDATVQANLLDETRFPNGSRRSISPGPANLDAYTFAQPFATNGPHYFVFNWFNAAGDSQMSWYRVGFSNVTSEWTFYARGDEAGITITTPSGTDIEVPPDGIPEPGSAALAAAALGALGLRRATRRS